ncbi:hypothetical protein PUN28_000028 [Cardiocondyla obscurior]|uniref:Uncharacterized protein n=1 Tax=Cardiocondyla obscurior TaxID=286306 RepID=A0AAW2GXU0_9HYME
MPEQRSRQGEDSGLAECDSERAGLANAALKLDILYSVTCKRENVKRHFVNYAAVMHSVSQFFEELGRKFRLRSSQFPPQFRINIISVRCFIFFFFIFIENLIFGVRKMEMRNVRNEKYAAFLKTFLSYNFKINRGSHCRASQIVFDLTAADERGEYRVIAKFVRSRFFTTEGAGCSEVKLVARHPSAGSRTLSTSPRDRRDLCCTVVSKVVNVLRERFIRQYSGVRVQHSSSERRTRRTRRRRRRRRRRTTTRRRKPQRGVVLRWNNFKVRIIFYLHFLLKLVKDLVQGIDMYLFYSRKAFVIAHILDVRYNLQSLPKSLPGQIKPCDTSCGSNFSVASQVPLIIIHVDSYASLTGNSFAVRARTKKAAAYPRQRRAT